MGRVTAVVVTYDSAAVIGGCLDALAAHAPEMPVVVVDNGSSDGTAELVAERSPAVALVRSARNGGYAAGINLGARHAGHGDDLLVLNPDTRIGSGAVVALTTALAAPNTGIAVPRLVQPDGSTALSQRRAPTVLRALGDALLGGERAGRVAALGEVVVDRARYTVPGVVDWASGAAMLVDRRCHEALDGWDESFFLYAEETDLCLRAADLGWRTRYTPGAVVQHIGGHGERTPLRELMVVNKAVLYRRRHGPVPSLAYRGALILAEALRAWRGPHQRAALWRLLGRRSRLRLPPTLSP
jgi:N-acetylglucosaminyl-diphospho-decaprenol L-rhamnosyltransferase